MRKSLFITLIAATALSTGLWLDVMPSTAASETPPPARNKPFPGPPGGCGLFQPGPRMDRMAGVLGLNDEQKQKIMDIIISEQEKAAPLHKALEEARRGLAKLAGMDFDESAIRKLAAQEAEARTELTVSRFRTRHRIDTVLTPEQRKLARLAEMLMDLREPGPHHGPGPGNCPPMPDHGDDHQRAPKL